MADKLLGKQYRELVEVSKLLSHEDFWDNYASQHEQFMPDKNKKGNFSHLSVQIKYCRFASISALFFATLLFIDLFTCLS